MNDTLCKGYTLSNVNENFEVIETCFAICADGQVIQSLPQKFSNDFAKGRNWIASDMTADEVRKAAEYCGFYAVPAIK
jgi:hypothetical protein